MSKEMKLIPKLRFPEFENKEWNVSPIDDYCEVFRGSTFSKSDITEDGSEPCIHYGELFTKYNEVISKVYSRTDKQDGFKSEAGDVLMPSSDVTPDGLARASAITLGNVILGGDMNILRPYKGTNSIFLSYLLNHSKREIIKLVSGTTVKHIYPSQIITCELPVIDNEAEQQKIASCLSSLDELIAAHKDKLDALKDHKKGLLQNLFPQEGETVPKVRFPEFEEDGEWELKPFSKFIKLYRGSSPRPIREYLTKEETGVNWIKIGDTSSITDFVIRSVSEKITPKGAEKSRRVKKGELILANSMSYGSTYLLEVEGCIYDGWFVLREYEEHFDKQFLLQLLNSEYTQGQYKRFAAGGIVQNISSEIVYSITLSKTSKEEQQKIASCLSAVDELIIAQQEKIDELQQHKKGLMQGLFPKTITN
jgi:type I restriction enzyme S subunit